MKPGMGELLQKTKVLDRHILQIDPLRIAQMVASFCRQQNQSALFCNVHMLMLAQEDESLALAMDSADYLFADGAPISWLQRRLTGRSAATVTGMAFLRLVCGQAQSSGSAVGFLGATAPILESLKVNLQREFPELKVTYCYAPAYVDGELTSSRETLQAINTSGIGFLFVGLGCPKQEKWMHRYAGELGCSVLGVGAAFDWLSGARPQPPSWMLRAGLGWLHRLIVNPSKMFSRYMIYNTKFIVSVLSLYFRRNRHP